MFRKAAIPRRGWQISWLESAVLISSAPINGASARLRSVQLSIFLTVRWEFRLVGHPANHANHASARKRTPRSKMVTMRVQNIRGRDPPVPPTRDAPKNCRCDKYRSTVLKNPSCRIRTVDYSREYFTIQGKVRRTVELRTPPELLQVSEYPG